MSTGVMDARVHIFTAMGLLNTEYLIQLRSIFPKLDAKFYKTELYKY